MNILITLTVLVLAITLSSTQIVRGGRRGGGLRSGAQGGEIAESSLTASDRGLDAQEALLQKKQARQERLDRRASRKERKRARAARSEAARLKAEEALNFETYENEANFHDVEAVANKDIADQFGLQIFSDNRHKENAAISESKGQKFNTATRLASQGSLDTEVFNRQEVVDESEFFDGEELSAAVAEEDLVNAKEASRWEAEQFVDAQDASQVVGQASRSNTAFGNDFFGNNDLFGGFSNPFKRK